MCALLKDDCVKSDTDQMCFAFKIERAELCGTDCEISDRDSYLEVEIKGKGYGHTYRGCVLEIYDYRDTSMKDDLMFRWDQNRPWKNNWIKKRVKQKSNESKTYSALVKKSSAAQQGDTKTITVRFTHPDKDHVHKVDIKVDIS